MAAYQCLNCGQIEKDDCCENPDMFCINDMCEEIKRLRAELARSAIAAADQWLESPPTNQCGETCERAELRAMVAQLREALGCVVQCDDVGLMQTNATIEQARTAIAAADQWLGRPETDRAQRMRDALRAQEPVAFVVPQARVSWDGSWEPGDDYFVSAEEASDYERRVGHPLYAAPVPAQQPLTDEQIVSWAVEAGDLAELCILRDFYPELGAVPEHWVPREHVRRLVRAIERAHGITE